jgi:hypothetical protein
MIGDAIIRNLEEIFKKLISGLKETFGNVLECIILYGTVEKKP